MFRTVERLATLLLLSGPFLLSGCATHRSRAHHAHDDDEVHCHDAGECAAMGTALLAIGLLGAAVEAAADAGSRPGEATSSPPPEPASRGRRAPVARYGNTDACLYNPECLPTKHPTCQEAPDGCCPC